MGIAPDIMTLAKGLGGGIPIGACLAKESVAQVFTPGAHASTFGGNPLACAAALAVCRVLLEGRVLDHAKRMGEYLAKSLAECKDRHRVIREVRGLGLLQGIELDIDARAIVADCLVRGVLVNATHERVLRFVPPLVITQREIDKLIDVLTAVFNHHAVSEKDAHH
jgi:acetylornithine aminotransferase